MKFSLGLFRSFFLLLAFTFLIGCTPDKNSELVVWPEVEKQMKPWARWWWMGSAVNEEDITLLLTEYSAQGIGGVEIAPIYGAKGFEDQYVEYLSPRWMELLRHTIATADSLGMGVDMTNGTGWPFGGPNITPEYGAEQLFIQKYQVSNSGVKDLLIQINDPKQRNVGASLIALTGYDDQNNTIDLISNVDSAGMFSWQPESGDWTLYAAFSGRSRQQVKRAAPGGAGYTFDHLSASALDHYLQRFDKAFGNNVPGVRCFFNDSYELFGASWAANFLEEFENRRGYSLKKYVRELAGEGDSSLMARIKADYRKTMSDMLLENFSTRWTSWVNSKGALTRNQSHGSPANLLDVYASVDIPEVETFGAEHFAIKDFFWDSLYIKEADHNPLFLKFSSSAANLTGKKLVSCETFTWLGEHFRVPLSQTKPEAEQVFLSGVNHIFYHGTTYSPRDAQWPGWLFYASVNFAPSNSFWPHISGLNSYLARCQSILQETTADNDFLVYWPVYDIWNSAKGLEMMMSVHSSKRWLQMPEVEDLMNNGYGFDYISDALLETLRVKDGQFLTQNGLGRYKALVVPAHEVMPLKTLKLIEEFSKAGVPVIMQNFPKDVPGLANLEERRNELSEITNAFEKSSLSNGIELWKKGESQILVTKNLEKALVSKGILKETLADDGLKFLRKKSSQGTYYFLVNHTSKDVDQVIDFNAKGNSALILDPLTGASGQLPILPSDGKSQLRVQLASGESLFVLITDKDLSSQPEWNYFSPEESVVTLAGNWNLDFVEGGPELPARASLGELKNWTSVGNESMNRFSGTALYSTTFILDDLVADDYLLDLGKVNHSARVLINGQDLGVLWSTPFKVKVGSYLRKGENELVVEVTNLMANRIRDMDIKGIEWRNYHEINFVTVQYRPFDASGWEVMPSGLEGPVTITPLQREEPSPASLIANFGEVLFDFGSDKNPKDAVPVPSNMTYSPKSGYGFDLWTSPEMEISSKKGGMKRTACTSTQPFYFSTDLPEGNYEVTVWLGNPQGESNNTVKVESRRLMLENISTKRNEVVERTFMVNVRTPHISGTDSIRRKSREYGYLNWDNKLTIEFNGEKPSVAGLRIRPAKKDITTLFLAGNSTVVDQENEPYASWGQMITRFFDNNVVVANYAESGESLISFKGARRLDKILSLMKPNDYIFIEFGHNDQKRKGEGIGPWTSFSDLLVEFVTKAKEKGGKPILVTPMQRRSFTSDGVIEPTHGEYPDAVRKVAKDLNLPLIDLQEMSKTLYESWGVEASKNAFVHYPANTFPGQVKKLEDNTHFNNFGAYQIALCVIKGIKEEEPSLAKFLTDAPSIDLTNPAEFSSFTTPHSLSANALKPDGN